ncbi:BQ5605_C011g06613 [Microbotryum silenes-dioicae]|uniref:BQ5605_C011g06613 protein n=1 Tax=Microbotryum silenes-dioicae TaxID=796604 RepID=A0A2X0LPK9_9BASI|nr:BQ5605_C011g06613 [Microbotryum silenes-dioicae]
MNKSSLLSLATSSSASPTINAGNTVPQIGPTTTRSKQGPTVQPVEDPNESDDESFTIDPSLEDIMLEEERAPDPANFSDNIGDESDSSLEEEASAHVAVIAYGPAEASSVTSNLVVSKSSHLAPPSIMDDDSEIVISGATAQPKGQALQSSIAGRSLLRPHSKGDHAKRTPSSSSSITTSSTLATGPKDLFAPYDGAHNTKSIVQEFSKPKRQRHRSDLTDQEKKVAGLWFQKMFLENILDGQGIWRSKRSLYDQSETFADEYNKSGRTRIEWSTKIADLAWIATNSGNCVLNIIKRAVLKCTYKAYGLDPERLPAAAAEKATLYLENTRWAAKELRCGAGARGPNLDQCTFEPEEDLQNDLLYEILVQIVAGNMRDRSAALQWPERGLDPSNEDHRELAFALVTHA